MGGPSLFFRTDNRPLTEITRKVRRALGKADTRELLETIGEEVAATPRRRFERGRDPDGGKWPMALSAREEGRKTLIKTGRLKDSYTYDVAPGGTSVEIGSNTKYAAIHHFGGIIRAKRARALCFMIGDTFVMRRSVRIPARPALGLNSEDEDRILKTTEDWIRLMLKGVL